MVLKVLIIGPAKSGKSLLAAALRKLLAGAGHSVTVTDTDFLDYENPADWLIETIPMAPIEIETVQVSKEPIRTDGDRDYCFDATIDIALKRAAYTGLSRGDQIGYLRTAQDRIRDLKIKVHELETSIGMHIQRRVHKMQDITGELAGYGNDHPKYTYEDWMDTVREGETRESYWEWVCDEFEKDGGKL